MCCIFNSKRDAGISLSVFDRACLTIFYVLHDINIVNLETYMRQIIIGKEGNQPFVITDDYVSRKHAIFSYEETTGAMTIKNTGTNGTFIKMGNHFQPIEQCNVNASSVVRLGPNFIFTIAQLFQPQVSYPPGGGKPGGGNPKERVDISRLRRIAESYEANKLKLEQKQATINSMRMLSIGGSLLGGTVGALLPKLLGDGENDPIYTAIGPIIAVIFLVILLLYCSRAGRQVIIKKNANEKRYKIAYCCPKCHGSLSGRLYENLIAEGKCPKCKTEYYDSKS